MGERSISSNCSRYCWNEYGITVAAGFNPADTIQVVATQGSGETISDEQRSDDFTVVAPQPNQATTKFGKMVILISRLITHQGI